MIAVGQGLLWILISMGAFASAVAFGVVLVAFARGRSSEPRPERPRRTERAFTWPSLDDPDPLELTAESSPVDLSVALDDSALIMRNSPDVLALCDPETGALTMLNRASFLGFAWDDLPGERSLFELLDPEGDVGADELVAAWRELQGDALHDVKLACRDAHARVRILRTRVRRLMPAIESTPRLLATFTDVTDEVAEIQRVSVLERSRSASSASDVIGPVARGIAHDLNGVLARVLACAERLGESGLSRPDRSAHACTIVDAVREAADLTDALRRLGTFEERVDTVDVASFVRDLDGTLRRLVGPAATLRIDAPAQACTVAIDARALEEVLLELVANARDASVADGDITVTVALEPDRECPGAGLVTLAVADAGSGIAKRVRERVFMPFVSTHGSGTRRGLGLALAREVVRSAGGTISFVSRPGRGSTFTIALPWQPVDHEIVLDGIDGPQHAVLVVDDEVVRGAVTAMLGTKGYRVTLATKTAEVLRIVSADPIDVLVVDTAISGVSASDLCMRVRSREPDVAVVMLSGYGRAGAQHATRRRKVAYVAKPFTRDALYAAIDEVGASRVPAFGVSTGG